MQVWTKGGGGEKGGAKGLKETWKKGRSGAKWFILVKNNLALSYQHHIIISIKAVFDGSQSSRTTFRET
jgi:hypothetical protein